MSAEGRGPSEAGRTDELLDEIMTPRTTMGEAAIGDYERRRFRTRLTVFGAAMALALVFALLAEALLARYRPPF